MPEEGKNFPQSRIVHHTGALFSVPFAILRTPAEEEGQGETDYKFKNPRMLTERGQADLLDKKLSSDLRESIRTRTLLCPLVCRWVQGNDGLMYPLVVGGDRRYRALDFLIRKREIVTDPRHVTFDEKLRPVYRQAPANEAYEKVLCQVFACETDLDALALAWAENKGRINLSEGHEVAEFIKLRKHHASDERIMEILQQDEKWLRDTDNLVNALDTDTLADLLEARIDRKSAIELAGIEDLGLRDKIRLKANERSQESCDKKIKRLQAEVEETLDQMEFLRAEAVDQEWHGNKEEAANLTEQAAQADAKSKRIKKERDQTAPVTTAKDVKAAKTEVIGNGEGESGEGGGTTVKDRPPRMLRAAQIKEGLTYIEAVIKAGKCPDGSFIAGPSTVDALKLLRKILTKNILANDSDLQTIIKRHVKKQDEDGNGNNK